MFPGGCFFASTTSEFDTRPGPVKDKIASVHQSWRELLQQLVVAAQADGSLDSADDPGQLAFELHAFLLMGNAGFVLDSDSRHLKQARLAITHRLSRTD